MAATPTTVPTLSTSQGILLLALVVGGLLVAGLIVILGRSKVPPAPGEQSGSVIRSWIAISLVIGLLVFCAAAFLVNDSTLRSTLFGGLIASVSAAVAFYFSSKTADQARADILGAAMTIAQRATKPSAFSKGDPAPANVGTPYSFKFAADGQPAPTYALAAGQQAPPGLALDPDGTLRGTPSKAGQYQFSITATNSAGALSRDVTLSVT